MCVVEHAFHNHVINVDFHGFPNNGFEQLVHKSLISGPRVLEPERHHLIAVQASIDDESSLLLILRTQGNLMISRESVHEA